MARMKKEIERIIATQKTQPIPDINNDDFDRLSSMSQLRFLLQASELPMMSNLAKSKGLYDANDLSYLTDIMGSHYFSEHGPHPITQTLYDKLVECLNVICKHRGAVEGLYPLTAAGLLNEETIELFVANPKVFNRIEEDFGEKCEKIGEPASVETLKAFIEDIIATQKEKTTPEMNPDTFDYLDDIDQLRLVLPAYGLPILSNLSKCDGLLKSGNLYQLPRLLSECYFSPSGPHPVTQGCYDSLIECIDLIKRDPHDEFQDLRCLASVGLLNEENIALFITNPKAFEVADNLALQDDSDEQLSVNEAPVPEVSSSSKTYKEKMQEIVAEPEEESSVQRKSLL